MTTSRVEAFSDGVIAIIVTVMVLELKLPQDASLAALLKLAPSFLSYGLSFLVVAITWVNHHHLLRAGRRVDAWLLWTNNNLLFWLSLIPFVTAYMGQAHTAPLPVAVYGGVLSLSAVSFIPLRAAVARDHRHDQAFSNLHRRAQLKNSFSAATYAAAAPLAYININISFFIFVLIPVLYFVPDRRFAEHAVE